MLAEQSVMAPRITLFPALKGGFSATSVGLVMALSLCNTFAFFFAAIATNVSYS